MPESPETPIHSPAAADSAENVAERRRSGTIPGLPPPPAPMSPEVGEGVAADPALDDDVHELGEEDAEPIDVEEAGELLAAGARPGGLPVGGEDGSGAHPLPPAPPEEPAQATVADLAAAEARGDDWAARAAELRAELEAETDRARAGLLAYELGEVTERRLHDEAGAVKSYGRALQSDPSLRPNLWSIRRVFYRRALWPNLLKLIDAEVRFARTDPERADLLVEKGQLLEDKLGDRAGARDAFDRATALDPTSRSALLGRERIALSERDNDALLRVWRQLADITEAPARKVAYLMDGARLVAALGLAGAPEASAPVLQEAQDIIAEATALGSAPGVDAAFIARERERLAELGGDTETILAALEARIALVGASRPREVVALRRRQARVARELGDLGRALAALEQAAALAPDDPIILGDLVEVAEAGGNHAVLARALGRLAAVESNARPARELYLALRRAEALAAAGQADDADAMRQAILERAPGYLPLVELFERDALTRGDGERLAALRLAEAEAALSGGAFGPGPDGAAPDPRWAAGAFVVAGDVYAFELGRPADARAAYERALETVPGYAPAVQALVGLHVEGGNLDAATELLERELPRAAVPEEHIERLAAMYGQLGRITAALGAVERLAALRPDDLALRERLEVMYAAAGQHERRVQTLEDIAGRVEEPARKAALLFEIGRVQEAELGAPESAIASYRRALAIDPHDRTVRGALLALLRRVGRWDELAGELRAEAEVADGVGALRSLRAAAAVLERRLGRRADAAALYRDLSDRAGGDAAAVRGLAASLAGQGGAEAEQAPVLEHEVGLSPPGAATAQALIRLGDLLERLGRDNDAEAAYARARDEGGVGMHAHWALVELAAHRRDRVGLAEALGAVAERTSDDAVRADLMEEVAWLGAGDSDAAAARFDEVVRRAPDRRGAQLGKALVAAQRRDAGELAVAIVAQAEQTTDAKAAAALLLRAATLAEVARDGRAAELAGRALALTPDDPGAVVAAAERPGADDDVRAALLARHVALTTDEDVRAEIELDRARLLARLGRLAEAGRALAAVLAARPDHVEALQLLRQIAHHAGDHETVARAALRLGRTLTEPGLAASYLAEAAALLDGPLGRPAEAGPVWRAVFDLDPEHPVAYARAHELAAATGGRGDALHELLGRKIQSLGPSADVVPHRMERARLARRRGDDDGAASDLYAVLELDPTHLEALSTLAEVREAQGDAGAAAELLRQHNEAVTDPDQRADAELRLASLLEVLGDRGGAIDALDIVLTARPDDVPARERLVGLLQAEHNHGRLAEEIERLAAQRSDGMERARDNLRAARVWRDKVHDTSRARRALDRGLAADPLNLDVLRELAALVDGPARSQMLEGAAAAVRTRLGDGPTPLRVLAAIAALAGDEGLGTAAHGALVALGAASDDEARRHGADRQRLAAQPFRARRILADDEWRTRIEHPGLRSGVTEAWMALAESVARAGETDAAALGFARGDRIAARAIAKQAPAVETAQRLFGVAEIDLYVTAGRTTFARAIGLEVPLVLLSTDVARGETLEARALLGRTLASARLRSAPVEDLEPLDLALWLGGGLKTAGADPLRVPALAALLGGQAPRLDERARAVAKTLGRKDKKTLSGIAERLYNVDLAGWIAAVRATHRRAALLACGDAPVVLRRADLGDATALDVVSWSVSEGYLYLRKDLGLA
jgi:tetratricopeptide (TPR) repeat protein